MDDFSFWEVQKQFFELFLQTHIKLTFQKLPPTFFLKFYSISFIGLILEKNEKFFNHFWLLTNSIFLCFPLYRNPNTDFYLMSFMVSLWRKMINFQSFGDFFSRAQSAILLKKSFQSFINLNQNFNKPFLNDFRDACWHLRSPINIMNKIFKWLGPQSMKELSDWLFSLLALTSKTILHLMVSPFLSI